MTVTTSHVASTAAAATSTTTTAGGGVGSWSTPMPYLFGAIALMLGLISIALLILACTEKRRSHHDEPKEKAAGEAASVVDEGPKVVVIMAGDENPTFLAKPVALPPVASPPRPLVGDEHV